MRNYFLVVLCLLIVGTAVAAPVNFTNFYAYGSDAWRANNDTYYVVKYNATGSHVWVSDGNATTIEYLAQAGGAGGGGGKASSSSEGGGGGAGGQINGTGYAVSGTVNITVGNGGTAGACGAAGLHGGNSSIANSTPGNGINAMGGGYGGFVGAGGNGGCGGGGGGSGAGGTGVAGQGYTGGTATEAEVSNYIGGGGAGTQTNGTSGNSATQGFGGVGLSTTITGFNETFGGGGGGGNYSGRASLPGLGGAGGGGNGGSRYASGVNGEDGRGSGGGGGGSSGSAPCGAGGDGGDGVVFIRYTKGTAPTSDFTVTPDNGMVWASFQFNDTSTNTPTAWNYSFTDAASAITWVNGTTVAAQNLTRSFSTGGNISIKLWSQNAVGGNYSATTKYLDIWNLTPASFAGVPRSGDNPLLVTFNASANITNATGFYWEFGDTITATTRNTTHTYTSVGSFTVNFKANNTHAFNWSNQSGYITVNTTTAADFTGAPVSGFMNPDFPVNFVDMSTGEGIYSWAWIFGDIGAGNTSTLRNPSHTYTAPGNYDVQLTIIGADDTSSMWKNDYVQISPLGANFTSNSTGGIPPVAIAFTDTSLGYPTSWNWSFGDGNYSSSRNATNIYVSDGLWTVKLHTNTTYESNWSNMTYYINTITPPTESFTANQTIGISPLAVQFNVTGSGGVPTMWNWSYWDGISTVWFYNTSIAANKNATHTFADVRIYNVTLTATNGGGYSTSGLDVEVVGTATADWSSYLVTGMCPLIVQFVDRSGNATSYNWSFGDGNVSADREPAHTYDVIGTFNVNFTVSNAYSSATLVRNSYVTTYPCTGGTPTATPTVTSAPFNATIARFVANITTGYPSLAVQFYDLSFSNITSWAWTFGDGDTSTLQNPLHVYNITGQYTVSLAVSSASGSDFVTKANYITVSEIPVSDNGVNFVGSPRSGNVSLVVGFTDLSSVQNRNITEWNWSFGDGNLSTMQNPFNTYAVAGDYDVTLSVNTSNLINWSILNATKTNYIHVTTIPVLWQPATMPMLPAGKKQSAPVQWIDDRMLWVVIALCIAVVWLAMRRR